MDAALSVWSTGNSWAQIIGDLSVSADLRHPIRGRSHLCHLAARTRGIPGTSFRSREHAGHRGADIRARTSRVGTPSLTRSIAQPGAPVAGDDLLRGKPEPKRGRAE